MELKKTKNISKFFSTYLSQLNQILREQLETCNKENIKLGETIKNLKNDLAEANEECDRLREEKLQISGKTNNK